MTTMRKFDVKLTGKSPLLLHWDNISWADAIKRWRDNPDNKSAKVPGDDRWPAFTWVGATYRTAEDGVVCVPVDNLMRSVMEGAVQVPVPGGRSGKTFKQQSQSGLLPDAAAWPILIDGEPVPFAPIWAARNELDFEKHEALARSLGFGLDVRRARVGAAKHVRVRPRLDRWACGGTVTVWDDAITLPVLRDFFRLAGDYKGLGDWRPSSPKSPGPFGRFAAEVAEL
jgi:hypothetical protein